MDKIVKSTVEALVASFVYYDRKEDEDLPEGELQQLIKSGELTVQDIAILFTTTLRDSLGEKV